MRAWDTARTEMFSDAVFAIAITLLVLDLDIGAHGPDALWDSIGNLWPSYLAFAISFITIGGMWLSHHSIFNRLKHVTGRMMVLNMALLMGVAFLPFPTSLMAQAINEHDAERAAVIFYTGCLLVVAIVIATMWRTIETHREMLKPTVTDEDVALMVRRARPDMGFYGIIIGLAFAAPRAAVFTLLVVAVTNLVGRSMSGPVQVD